MLQVYEAAARACAHINIRASRARMMTINRGINGVSDKDPMRDVEVAPDAPARVAVRSPAAAAFGSWFGSARRDCCAVWSAF